MSKYYIIQEIGFEYNDEYYYRSQDSAGKPQIVFKKKTLANQRVDELNYKKFCLEEIGGYAESVREIIEDVEGFVQTYNELFDKDLTEDQLDESFYEFTLPKMTLAQYKILKPYISLNFYEVVECEGEE